MKTKIILTIILTIIFIVISNFVISQNTIKSCPSVSNDLQQAFGNRIIQINQTDFSEDYKDLEFLKKIIGDNRFVLLGESSHFVEEYSKIKKRLIKFLHKEMGFDVILFESDFFNCNTSYLICDSLSTKEFLDNSIFGLWHTKINYKLFEYIKETKKTETPLLFSGFDIRKSNITENQLLYAYYKNYLKPKDYAEFVNLDTITNKYFRNVILNKNKKAFNQSLSLKLTDRYNTLQNSINKYKKNIDREIFKRIILNKKYLINIIEIAKSDAKKYIDMRDKFMAENIEWIADNLYPDKKIIIWAHNAHVMNNKEYMSMGYYFSDKIKKQSYTVGIFGLKGSWGYGENIHNENNLKKNSLEAVICNTNNEISFINLNENFNIDYNKKVYLWKQKKTIRKINQEYDGLLFIRNITPSIYLKQ
ncbi:MAG: erythromycin esterase family protein [Bacteroidales bacterium]|nr:erythromycin esterase family protein [Bacteroidales bacterium]